MHIDIILSTENSVNRKFGLYNMRQLLAELKLFGPKNHWHHRGDTV